MIQWCPSPVSNSVIITSHVPLSGDSVYTSSQVSETRQTKKIDNLRSNNGHFFDVKDIERSIILLEYSHI